MLRCLPVIRIQKNFTVSHNDSESINIGKNLPKKCKKNRCGFYLPLQKFKEDSQFSLFYSFFFILIVEYSRRWFIELLSYISNKTFYVPAENI
jgi:hypothetical protein